jgi:hypothetical protein
MGGDAGEGEIHGGILWSALPQRDEIGFGLVETARIVTVAQSAGEAELILRVGGVASKGRAESGDRIVVVVGAGCRKSLLVERAASPRRSRLPRRALA